MQGRGEGGEGRQSGEVRKRKRGAFLETTNCARDKGAFVVHTCSIMCSFE